MGPQKSIYMYIKAALLSNEIAGSDGLSASLFIAEDKVDKPSNKGHDGNEMPDEFGPG
jgi:hypothetical protein